MVVAILAGTVGLAGYNGMIQVKILQDKGATVNIPSLEALLKISESISVIDSAENSLLYQVVVGKRQRIYNDIIDNLDIIEKKKEIFNVLPRSNEMTTQWDRLLSALEEWKLNDTHFIKLSKIFDATLSSKNKIMMMNQVLFINSVSMSTVKGILDSLVEINLANTKAENLTADAATNATSIILLVLIVVTVIFSILLGVFISNIIRNPLYKTIKMLQEMSLGHLEMRLNLKTMDEIGVMAQTMD